MATNFYEKIKINIWFIYNKNSRYHVIPALIFYLNILLYTLATVSLIKRLNLSPDVSFLSA